MKGIFNMKIEQKKVPHTLRGRYYVIAPLENNAMKWIKTS